MYFLNSKPSTFPVQEHLYNFKIKNLISFTFRGRAFYREFTNLKTCYGAYIDSKYTATVTPKSDIILIRRFD